MNKHIQIRGIALYFVSVDPRWSIEVVPTLKGMNPYGDFVTREMFANGNEIGKNKNTIFSDHESSLKSSTTHLLSPRNAFCVVI